MSMNFNLIHSDFWIIPLLILLTKFWLVIVTLYMNRFDIVVTSQIYVK